MSRQKLIDFSATLMLILVLGVGIAAAQKPGAEALFRDALMKERAEGKLQEAIFRYERVIAEFPKERTISAQAMYQLSLAYQQLGDPRAKLLLTRLSRDYADVEPYAGRARARLAQLAAASQPLFPEAAVEKSFELGSPDGRYVIYHKDLKTPGDDWGREYLKEVTTGKEQLLLDHPGKNVSNFAWSPDSSRIAFNFQDDSGTKRINDIRIVRVPTGETVSLAASGYPIHWTDTGEIFFYRPNYKGGGIDYWLIPASGGEARKVYFSSTTEGCCPLITPDAKSLIVGRSKKLFLVNLQGSEEKPITNGAGEETRPLLSPDGRLLAFASNYDGNWAFYVAPLDRGIPVRNPLRIAQVAEPGEGFAWIGRQWWTRDGLLTFGVPKGEKNIYRLDMDPATGRAIDAPRRMTQDTPNNSNPAVSPDGKHIAYFYQNGSRRGIAIMDENGLNERPLIEEQSVLPLSWRSPEELLFYRMKPKPGENSSIHSLDINTGLLARVAEVEGLYWFFVPGRNEILHIYPGGGGPRQGETLKAFSLNDGRDRVVATIDFLGHMVSVSPDGQRIAYWISRPVEGSNQRMYEIATMSISGEFQETLIPAQAELIVPMDWSPDGRFMLYSTQTGPRIMDVRTKESWPLHQEVASASWSRAAWSPNGRFIVITGSTPREFGRLSWQGLTYDAVVRLMQNKGKSSSMK